MPNSLYYTDLRGANATASTGSLVPSSTATMLQIATGSSKRARLVGWGFDAPMSKMTLAPITINLQRQTSTGTGGLASTVVKWDSTAPANTVTGAFKNFSSWTAEPTAGDILATYKIQVTNSFSMSYSLGREPIMDVSSFLAITITSASSSLNLINVYMVWEE